MKTMKVKITVNDKSDEKAFSRVSWKFVIPYV